MVSKEFFLDMVLGKITPRIKAIEEFTSRYPWCAVGHKSLFTTLCGQSEEAYLSYISKASLYLFNREELFKIAHSPRPPSEYLPEPFIILKSDQEKNEEVEIDISLAKEDDVGDVFEMLPDNTPQKTIVVDRGDYFGQEMVSNALLEENNPIDNFIRKKPRINKQYMSRSDNEGLETIHQSKRASEETISLKKVGDDNFMTETLAKIYADQSLYQLAIEAYEKLILLYPKKSDYFASLIQSLKYKMVR